MIIHDNFEKQNYLEHIYLISAMTNLQIACPIVTIDITECVMRFINVLIHFHLSLFSTSPMSSMRMHHTGP